MISWPAAAADTLAWSNAPSETQHRRDAPEPGGAVLSPCNQKNTRKGNALMYRTLAAALAISTLTAPALAATDAFKMEIEFSRASLATVEGASAEYAKIRDQVIARCETEHEAMALGKRFAVHACTSRTLGNAVRKIADPLLTSVHKDARA